MNDEQAIRCLTDIVKNEEVARRMHMELDKEVCAVLTPTGDIELYEHQYWDAYMKASDNTLRNLGYRH